MADTNVSTAKNPQADIQSNRVGSLQILKGVIHTWTNGVFKSTLGQEEDIDNLFLALMHYESKLQSGAMGVDTNKTEKGIVEEPTSDVIPITASGKFLRHPKIIKITDPQQRIYVRECIRAVGMIQSMGHNHVKGVNPDGSGLCEIEKHGTGLLSTDMLNRLLILPGDSITKVVGTPMMWEEQNMRDPTIIENQIVAGLLILHSKYKNVKSDRNGFRVGTSGVYHSKKIYAAMAAYLGVNGKDAMGSDGSSYVSGIMRSSYHYINGTFPADNGYEGNYDRTAAISNQRPVGCPPLV